MKSTTLFTIVSAFALAISSVSTAEEAAVAPAPAPAAEQEAKIMDLTGSIFLDGDKNKLREDSGTVYLITKNNDATVAAYVGKKVKITGKVKSKVLANGNTLNMVVYVKNIAEVAAEAPEKAAE